MLKCFVFSKPSSGLKNGEISVVRTIMVVWIKYTNWGKEKILI